MRGAFLIVTREPRPRMGFAGSGCAGCRWQFRGCSVSSLLLIGVLLGSSYPFFVHAATDTLSWNESLALNNTLQSSDGQFILGFFPLGSSPKRYYLGVWFNTTTLAVVWVANRERPLNDTAGGTLTILKNGTLAVLDAAGTLYWSSSSTQSLSSNSTAKLGTDGSFVLSSADGSRLWSSFDHPTDTFIPKLVLTADPSNNQSTRLVSWKGKEDPAPGNYSLGLDPKGSPQLYIWNGEKVRWRSGQWNKVSFIGLTRMRPLSVFGFNLVAGDNNSLSLSFIPPDKTPLRFVITWNGIERTTSWNNSTGVWDVIWEQPLTPCETYNYCGDNAICSNNSTCECLRGFQPRSGVEGGDGNWTGGCIRRSPLACQSNSTNSNSSDGVAGDWFATIDDVKLPNFAETALRLSQSECAALCSGNCSCIGYAYVSDIGCMVWADELVDIARFDNNSNSQTLFLKLSPSEFTESATSDDKNKIRILWAVLPTVFVVAILCVFLCIGWRYKTRIIEWWRNGEEVETTADPASGRTVTDFSGSREQLVDGEQTGAKASDLPMFSFEVIAAATDNFCDSNKLGQGGFGLVYRGVLPGGDEVAVKRLSGNSGQGIDEFKNEVTLIAKMQHRNLVRLLGCCIQGEEKLLLYEYMPNKSLDSFLFDPTRQPMLDWRKRFDIIEGIARGLLYLHRDSRLRVVHRDLKPSNILLDEEMNPKISDFGMARIFGGNQNSDSTNRVVGTFGYMSPEYAMEGLFSIKSDVYSFGVLILEIVSGKKNSRTRAENYLNLLAYVWQLWTTDRVEEILDPCIRDSCSRQQVLRCIHIGLLCAQDRAFDRPTMSAVVIMLGTDAPIHQVPKQPTFAAEGSPSDTGSHTQSHKEDGEGYSVNDVTITVLSGR